MSIHDYGFVWDTFLCIYRAGSKVLNMPGQDVHASCILAGHLQDLAGHV